MMRYALRLMAAARTEPQVPGHREVLAASLRLLCCAVCRALAMQELFAAWEGLVDAAELLWVAADVFPSEFLTALDAGLEQVTEVPTWSRASFHRHLAERSNWPKRSAWICEMQTMIPEWQR